MKELVIISGKGGSGKTSVAASFAVLAQPAVIADCDVDAADLHLLMSPRINERHEFHSGHEAVIRQEDCIGCGACLAHCRFEAVVRMPTTFGSNSVCKDCEFCVRSCPVRVNEMIRAMRESSGYQGDEAAFYIDPVACEGCGVCVQFCPVQAIDFPECLCGEWMVSDTRCGPMVHARLGIAAENSGKLVCTVRREARRIAEERNHELIIVDGPPGIGCPVIASITGSDLVLAVTEPTPSGEHDLKRVVQLARHFGIPMAVCINKWDINEDMSARIETFCNEQSIPLAGKIRYDQALTRSQIQGQAVVEAEKHGAAADLRNLWAAISATLLQFSNHAA
ncbi:MAG: 4Fe-4S binding protein [Phycisphaerales bacterium]|nr:4Fe-4S binding protein [Phycisphaerales bacterium]